MPILNFLSLFLFFTFKQQQVNATCDESKKIGTNKKGTKTGVGRKLNAALVSKKNRTRLV